MYALLGAHSDVMPDRARHMLPYMVEHDWLNTYATLPGIGGALAGLAKRSGAGAQLAGAETVLEEYLSAYTEDMPRLFAAIANALVPCGSSALKR
jgi:acyl carrier protein phosphodiesterase